MAAVRYIALNPVRARLVARVADWRWSSVPALRAGRDDGLTRVAPVLARCQRQGLLLGAEPTRLTTAAPVLARRPGFAKLLDEPAEQPGLLRCAAPNASAARSAVTAFSPRSKR